jgi:hypothetical protein
MCRAPSESGLLFAVLICVAATFGSPDLPILCAESPAAKQPSPPSDTGEASAEAGKSPVVWGGPAIQQIEKDWSAMTVPPDTMVGSRQLVRGRQLEALLKKRLPKEDIPGLIASLGKVPIDEEKQTEFQRMFIEALESILLDGGDRENLATLFSTHFQNRYSSATMEWVLVAFGKMKDPILVLADAYERSKNPVIRKRIATAVHQSFDGVGVKGKDDAEFIGNAMKWYKDNKDRLVPNPRHDLGDTMQYSWRECPLYYIKGEDDEKDEK